MFGDGENNCIFKHNCYVIKIFLIIFVSIFIKLILKKWNEKSKYSICKKFKGIKEITFSLTIKKTPQKKFRLQ